MNLPKQLFYFNIPFELLRNELPDKYLATESLIQNNKVISVRFLEVEHETQMMITDMNELLKLAKQRAQALHDQNSVTALGTITDPSNVMPGILHDMNSVNQSSKVLNN
jgi:hypothetical protein